MIDRRVFSFLKNFLIFFINRLYKEWIYIRGKRQSYGEGVSERGDLYAKQIIENIIHDRARKCDPYMVDGIVTIYYGKTSIHLGQAYVTGLSTLDRTNICNLKNVGNRIFLQGTFGAGPLTYQREIIFKFGDFNRKMSVLISLMDIKVSVGFSIEKETGRNGFLLNFAVNELNEFNLSINGLGYFDWIINLVFSFFTLVLGRMVRNLLENELEQYILHRLPKYQFPVEGASYRNGTKFNISPKDVQNNEASLYKTFYMKQNFKRPKSSRVPPATKKTKYDVGKECNSIKFGSNQETTNSSRSFLVTDSRTTEVNSCFSEQNFGDCRGSLPKNSCNDVSKDKSEENCNHFSALPRETQNITSLNEIKENLVSFSNIAKSSSQGIILQSQLKDACPLFNRNYPIELNDLSEGESNSRQSMACETSSPANSFGPKVPQNVSLYECEKLENTEESKMEDFSKMLKDFCEDLVEKAFEGISERVNEVSGEIRDLSFGKSVDENTLDVGIELPINLANYDQSSSTKTESTHIDLNILEEEAETLRVEGRTFLKMNPNRNLKMFNCHISEEQNGRIEDSNKNKNSMESCIPPQSHEIDCSALNLDLKLCNAETVQNDFLFLCKDEALAKDLESKIETQIADSDSIDYTEMQSVEMNEKQYNSNPDDKVDDQTNFKCDIIPDSIELALVSGEKNSVAETETEMISTSLRFSEKHEDKVNEKINFRYSESPIREDGKDTLNIADDWYTSSSPRSSEMLNISNFQNEDTACSSNLRLKKLGCLSNENVSKCTDCLVELSPVAGLELNENPPKNILAETSDLKVLNNLQKEIIARIFKLKYVTLESNSEENE